MTNLWRERWSRERGTPLRYVLVEERDHGPEGWGVPYAPGYDLLAKCADVAALSDAVVGGRRPCPSDSSLVDVTVQAGVEPISVCAEPPSDERQKRFAFTLSFAEGYTPYGSCTAVPRLFEPRKRPEPVELGLRGCDPDAPIVARGRGSTRPDILAVDRTGRVMTATPRTAGAASTTSTAGT
ncbi:hypothetical protein AB0O22_06680 [Streptomyces sp. NPDC091204]|uniref:hypothetical protein n=1 Tax=Streptomyces sp. NPDC091204 TaxID=3155299 RepID=UPI00343E1C95